MLGVRVPAAALPCRTKCPFCSAEHQFTVYQDPVYSGQWTHCQGCNWAGDIIELAAEVWKTDVKVASRRLLADGLFHLDAHHLDRLVDAYRDQFVNYRRKITAFWERSRTSARIGESGEIRALLTRINIPPDVDLGAWQRHGGRFIGAANRKEVEDSLRVSDLPRQTPSADGGRRRTFVGNGWGDVLVVPAFDLPGRIRSFAFIGRRGRPDEDVVVRPIRGNTGSRTKELGLAMLPAAFGASRVVIADELIPALRKQHQHLQDHSTPLPLVVRLTDGERRTVSYTSLGGAEPVFWGMRASAELVDLARATHGRVCTEESVTDTATKHLSRIEPARWIDRAFARSKDWAATLEERQRAVGDQEGASEVSAMSLSNDERNEIRTRDDLPTARARMARAESGTGLTVQIGSNLFGEGRDGLRRNGELLVNARLRIDELVTVGGVLYYRGSVGFKDDEIPFVETADKVEKSPLAWMRERVLAAGKGVVVYGKGHGTQITQIAMQLHPPRSVRGADRVGWRGDPAGFVFGDFAVSGDGFDRDAGYPLKAPGTPTAGCLADPLTAADWHALTEPGAVTEMFWAVATAVVANVAAPAYAMPTAAIGLVGTGSGLAARMAGWLGCAAHRVAESHHTATRIAGLLVADEARHGWPVAVPPQSGTTLFRTWAATPTARNSLWVASWHESRAGTMTGEWTRVEADAAGDSTRLVRPAAKLAPSFLQWMCERNLDLGSGPTLTDRVLHAMAKWVLAHGYDATTVLKARAMLDGAAPYASRAAQVAEAFGELAGRLHDEQVLPEAGTTGKRKIPGVVTGPDRVWVPKAVFYRALAGKGLPAPDERTLTTALVEAGVLLGQEDRLDPLLAGWVFSYDWWKDQCASYRETKPGVLRLVS